jgi:hypothetical protein
MSELERWMKLLLDKGVSAKGMREFKNTYQDLIFSTSINEDVDRIRMLEIIDYMGEDDSESEIMRRYLYYIYGKFISADVYAGCIGKSMADADDDWKMLLDSIMDDAINKITDL